MLRGVARRGIWGCRAGIWGCRAEIWGCRAGIWGCRAGIWGCRVEAARGAHHAEASVAGVVVAQLEGDREERGPQLALLAAVLQRRVEPAVRGDRPAVQREAFGVSLLRQRPWRVLR